MLQLNLHMRRFRHEHMKSLLQWMISHGTIHQSQHSALCMLQMEEKVDSVLAVFQQMWTLKWHVSLHFQEIQVFHCHLIHWNKIIYKIFTEQYIHYVNSMLPNLLWLLIQKTLHNPNKLNGKLQGITVEQIVKGEEIFIWWRCKQPTRCN